MAAGLLKIEMNTKLNIEFFQKSSKVVKFSRDACVINSVTLLKYTSHDIKCHTNHKN